MCIEHFRRAAEPSAVWENSGSCLKRSVYVSSHT